MKNLFVVSSIDAQNVAQRKIGRKLSVEELDRVKSGLEFGLEYWEDVIKYAIDEIVSKK